MKPFTSMVVSLMILAGIFTALAVTAYTFAFGPARGSAVEMAFQVREQKFTEYELDGAKTLSEAQHELDSGHAEIITANAKQWEANNGALLVFGIIILFALFVVTKSAIG